MADQCVYLMTLTDVHERLERQAGWPMTRPRDTMRAVILEQAEIHNIDVFTEDGYCWIEKEQAKHLVAVLTEKANAAVAFNAERDREDRERGFDHPLVTVTDHPGVLVPPGGGVISAGREPG